MELLDYTEFARSRQMDCARTLRQAERTGIAREPGRIRLVFRKPGRSGGPPLAA